MKFNKSTVILLNVVLILAIALLLKSLISVPKNLYAITTPIQQISSAVQNEGDLSQYEYFVYACGNQGILKEDFKGFEKRGFKLDSLHVVSWGGGIQLVAILKQGKNH